MASAREIMKDMASQPVRNLEKLYEKVGWTKDWTVAPGPMSKMVALQLNNTSGLRTYFQPDSVLDNSRICAIEVIDITTLSANTEINSTGGDLDANPSAAELAGAVIVLRRQDHQIAWIPAVSCLRRVNGGKYCLMNIEKLVWADSFVLLTGTAFALPVISIRVWYEPLN